MSKDDGWEKAAHGMRANKRSGGIAAAKTKLGEETEHSMFDLLELIASGDTASADALLDGLIGAKVGMALDDAREQIAQSLFATTEGDVFEEEFLSQEEFDSLTEDEQWKLREERDADERAGDREDRQFKHKYNKSSVDKAITSSRQKIGKKEGSAIHRLLKGRTNESVESLDEGNAENKAKKGEYVAKRGTQSIDREVDMLKKDGATGLARELGSKRNRPNLQKMLGRAAMKKDGKENGDLNKNKKNAVMKHIMNKIANNKATK
jgi:hypothetical protein